MTVPLTDPAIARTQVAVVQARLAAGGIAFRAPPPEPTTCCGRGCDGCVWEGYLAAVGWWLEDAAAIERGDGAPSARAEVLSVPALPCGPPPPSARQDAPPPA